MKIINDTVVEIIYKITDVDGEFIDQTEPNKPLTYLHGHENIIPGLEKRLADKQAGDKFTATIPVNEAYGEYQPKLVETVHRDTFFAEDEELAEGMLFSVETGKGVIPFYIKTIKDKLITLDANHKLAGKELVFDVEVISVRTATFVEASRGLPEQGQ